MEKDYCVHPGNIMRAVLMSINKSQKWLAKEMGRDPATISKWCTNTAQPSLPQLMQIARLLEVDVRELIRPE